MVRQANQRHCQAERRLAARARGYDGRDRRRHNNGLLVILAAAVKDANAAAALPGVYICAAPLELCQRKCTSGHTAHYQIALRKVQSWLELSDTQKLSALDAIFDAACIV